MLGTVSNPSRVLRLSRRSPQFHCSGLRKELCTEVPAMTGFGWFRPSCHIHFWAKMDGVGKKSGVQTATPSLGNLESLPFAPEAMLRYAVLLLPCGSLPNVSQSAENTFKHLKQTLHSGYLGLLMSNLTDVQFRFRHVSGLNRERKVLQEIFTSRRDLDEKEESNISETGRRKGQRPSMTSEATLGWSSSKDFQSFAETRLHCCCRSSYKPELRAHSTWGVRRQEQFKKPRCSRKAILWLQILGSRRSACSPWTFVSKHWKRSAISAVS